MNSQPNYKMVRVIGSGVFGKLLSYHRLCFLSVKSHNKEKSSTQANIKSI